MTNRKWRWFAWAITALVIIRAGIAAVRTPWTWSADQLLFSIAIAGIFIVTEAWAFIGLFVYRAGKASWSIIRSAWSRTERGGFSLWSIGIRLRAVLALRQPHAGGRAIANLEAFIERARPFGGIPRGFAFVWRKPQVGPN